MAVTVINRALVFMLASSVTTSGKLLTCGPGGICDRRKDRQIERLECQTGGEEAESAFSGNDNAGCNVTDFDNMRGM
jgi:N-methylhydantoinase B/oxoprolinase/acetone carboxylase alpha subunit